LKIALTGATGFIGKYIVERLVGEGHSLRCWYRSESNRKSLEAYSESIEWVAGNLDDQNSADPLIQGCDAVVHNALWRPGRPGEGFRGTEGDLVEFTRINLLGTLNLIQRSIALKAKRFVFVSTCAVHEKILDDRPLDEAHPLWPLSHYGAHKAAIEKFVHSFGYAADYSICSIRPSGVYGIRNPLLKSKWHALLLKVVAGEDVEVAGGGKEVHASDVAKGIGVLLGADNVSGESYSCCDRYISQYEVASIAKEISGSKSHIIGEPKQPKHQIVTDKIEALGMQFGGEQLLRSTVAEMVERIRKAQK